MFNIATKIYDIATGTAITITTGGAATVTIPVGKHPGRLHRILASQASGTSSAVTIDVFDRPTGTAALNKVVVSQTASAGNALAYVNEHGFPFYASDGNLYLKVTAPNGTSWNVRIVWTTW